MAAERVVQAAAESASLAAADVERLRAWLHERRPTGDALVDQQEVRAFLPRLPFQLERQTPLLHDWERVSCAPVPRSPSTTCAVSLRGRCHPQTWRFVAQHVLTPEHPLAVHQALLAACYAQWPRQQLGPHPVWLPDSERTRSHNVTKFLQGPFKVRGHLINVRTNGTATSTQPALSTSSPPPQDATRVTRPSRAFSRASRATQSSKRRGRAPRATPPSSGRRCTRCRCATPSACCRPCSGKSSTSPSTCPPLGAPLPPAAPGSRGARPHRGSTHSLPSRTHRPRVPPAPAWFQA